MAITLTLLPICPDDRSCCPGEVLLDSAVARAMRENGTRFYFGHPGAS